MGPFDEVCAIKCNNHKPLVHWLSKWFENSDTSQLLNFHRDYWSSSFAFTLGNHHDKSTPELDVVESTEKNQYAGYGVEVDPHWIDDNKLKQWYKDCINNHDGCRKPPYLERLPIPVPSYFIDTLNNCLAPAPPHAPYVALSYVWGQADVVKVLNSNSDKLQVAGALDGPEKQVSLPKTVRHAMHLTKLLGERYLWVDSLCIVQDDEQSQNDHLNRMASIFAYANAVIISVDGEHADSGLCGLRSAPSAEPRHLEQEVIPFGTRRILKRTKFSKEGRPPRDSGTKEKVYFDRGWTFQEFLFARRRICFENDSVWFQCCRDTVFEDHCHKERAHDARDWILDVGYPSLTVYSRLVADFNRRQLKYPQDCLSAIQGILPCYNKVFKGGFLCGLPEMFFDVALLWHPGGDLTRRERVETGKRYKFANELLPSWSWVGWQGVVDFDDWSTGNDFVANCSGWIGSSRQHISPVTTWYTSNDASGVTERRKIEVAWSEWRDRYKGRASKLPPGWKKRRRRRSETFSKEDFPDGYGKELYWHKSCQRAEFWFPVPLSDADSQPHPTLETAFLFGSVETARLYATGPLYPHHHMYMQNEPVQSVLVTLVNAQNDWAGVLRLHSRDYCLRTGLDPIKDPIELELIAISQGSIPNGLTWEDGINDFREYLVEERPKDGDSYEYYNVMWISWRDGIAFREAVGRVYKRMWASLNPSTIQVVLG
ncbi:hypothetical protein N8I77_005340 [Diaporthe amygdali]|uniref:Heterokaryon incompatibility domain-containing protein n=1 Tax=Phomopsis amygdali TaxID=1214568 RepID=A0AAD9SFI9_PHOAM|nr:hypothetical protein N8I77_005340 [Diaporthe amygdali]